jgi:hypothetical protein
VILGCFRRSDADDPEIYVAAAVRVLMAYPSEIVATVADPLAGIAGKQTFLPSIAELKAECDRRHAEVVRRVERQRCINEQIDRRRLIEDRSRRPTLEQLKEKFGPTWGLGGAAPRENASRPVSELQAMSGMTDEDFKAAWDALPNALAK